MKNLKQWKEEGIIGNKREAVEQAIESLKTAYMQLEKGIKTGAMDSIECALNRLGVEALTQYEIDEQRKSEYVKMSF